MAKRKKAAGVIGILVLLAVVGVGSFIAGRNSVKSVSGTTFYAVIEEIQDNGMLVEGLEVNDVNHRGRFHLTVKEDTVLEWRHTKIVPEDLEAGDRISVTYTGAVLEISPALIEEVLEIQLLEDEK